MEQLGVEPKLLIAQIVNFLIIIFVLTKLLYQPILRMLAKRKKEIEEGLALTEKLRLEEEKLAAKREQVLDAARKEGQKLIDEARGQAAEAEKEIVAEAHVQAEEIIKRARAETERLRGEMEKDLRTNAVALATAMARKLLSSVLSAKDQHKLIAAHVKKLSYEKNLES